MNLTQSANTGQRTKASNEQRTISKVAFVHFSKAQTLRLMNDSRALESISTACSLKKNNFDFICEYVDCMYTFKMPADYTRKSLSLLAEAISQHSDNPTLYFKQSLIRIDSNELSHALDSINRAISCNKPTPSSTPRLVKANKIELAEYYHTKAFILTPPLSGATSVSNIVEAIECFKKAVSLDNESPCLHVSLGNAYLTVKDFDSALVSFKKAQLHDPNYVETYHGIGKVYNELGDFKSAIKMNDRALEFDPTNVTYLTNKGIYLYRIEKFEESISVLRHALSLDKNNNNIKQTLNMAIGVKKAFDEFDRRSSCISSDRKRMKKH